MIDLSILNLFSAEEKKRQIEAAKLKNQAEAIVEKPTVPEMKALEGDGDEGQDEEDLDYENLFALIPSRPEFKIRDASHAIPIGRIEGRTKALLYTNKTLDSMREAFVLKSSIFYFFLREY